MNYTFVREIKIVPLSGGIINLPRCLTAARRVYIKQWANWLNPSHSFARWEKKVAALVRDCSSSLTLIAVELFDWCTYWNRHEQRYTACVAFRRLHILTRKSCKSIYSWELGLVPVFDPVIIYLNLLDEPASLELTLSSQNLYFSYNKQPGKLEIKDTEDKNKVT